MKEYAGKSVRNVVVMGHTGAGKTEVLESVLFINKITDCIINFCQIIIFKC